MTACSIDHTSVRGKFCPQCGDKIEDVKKLCANGHTMVKNSNFCAKCGEKAESPINVCANGHLLKKDAKYCGTCGGVTRGKFQSESSSPITKVNRAYIPSPAVSSQPIIRTVEGLTKATSPTFQSESTPSEFGSQLPEKKKNYGLIASISVLVLIIGVIVLGSVSSRSEPVTVTVEMTLVDEDNCFNPSWGYSDIPGGQVVVEVDGMKYFGSYDLWGESTYLGCKYTAKISNVPSDGVNYSVGMASGRRGTIYNSREELVSSGWTFSLTLG